MKSSLPLKIITLGILLILCTTANADVMISAVDYKLDNMVDHLESYGYLIVEKETSAITYIRTFTYYLEPGTYHAFSDGTENIKDMGFFVYDENGAELDHHVVIVDTILDLRFLPDGTMVGPYASNDLDPPYVGFILDRAQTIELELEVFEYMEDQESGYIFLVLAMETDEPVELSDDTTTSYGPSPDIRLRYTRLRYDHFDPWFWNDWFTEEVEYLEAWDTFWSIWDNDTGEFSQWYEWNGKYQYNNRTVDPFEELYIVHSSEFRDTWDEVEGALDLLYLEAYGDKQTPVMDHVAEIPVYDSIEITLPVGGYVLYAAADSKIKDLFFSFTDPNVTMLLEDSRPERTWAMWFRLREETHLILETEAVNVDDELEAGIYCILLCQSY